MNRPTIADLAEAAGVSVSTVNRILSGTTSVRGQTMQRVQSAAERIGFYGIGAIEDRLRKTAPNYRMGFLLQQSTRELYQLFSRNIVAACRARRDEIVNPIVDFVDLLTPDNISARLMALGRDCDAVAVVAADHPLISQAIRELREKGHAGRVLYHRSVGPRARRLCWRGQLEARPHSGVADRADDTRPRTNCGVHRQSPLSVPRCL